MPKSVSIELYEQYKTEILEMSLAVQRYEGTTMVREESGLSDREIAERLGLEVDDVTEIRCIAEVDLIPPETWIESERWKRDRIRKAFPSSG